MGVWGLTGRPSGRPRLVRMSVAGPGGQARVIGSIREDLAAQARALGRDRAAPDAMLANVPVTQRERQALAAYRAGLANGDRGGSLPPGLLRPGTDREPLISVEAAIGAPGLPNDARPCLIAHRGGSGSIRPPYSDLGRSA
jgi:hypothetical protein